MLFLFFEILIWIVISFVVGLLIGAWLGCKICKARKSASNIVLEERPANLMDSPAEHPDDLKRIAGVGPKLEKLLNSLGIYTYQQIAEWRQSEVEWVNSQINFSGRIDREQWREQAKILAKGEDTYFSKKYDKKETN